MPAEDSKYPMPVNRQAKIWRYMSLTKFAAMLEQQAIWFSSPRKFDDPFEGTFSKKPLTGKNDHWMEARAQSFETTRALMMRRSFVNCWFMEEHESEAFWKIYGSGQESIAVQTSVEQFCKLAEHRVTVGLVQYIDYLTESFDADNVFNLLFHKRLAFKHEKEFRAVVYDPELRDLDGMLHKFDLAKLLQSIVVAPGASQHFESFTRKILKTYDLEHLLKTSELDIRPSTRPVYLPTELGRDLASPKVVK